jgi:hypothetical protein
MIGDSKISKHEAEVIFMPSAGIVADNINPCDTKMIQSAFRKELEKFDRDRVLLAWDGLISKQQATLACHSVPTMIVSMEGEDREVGGMLFVFHRMLMCFQRQQRVIQVLENIVGS